ncbi:hypothetical protein [Methylomonas sp. AM2-LC]|uniref:hypothetical protein n=1 Tax=Methylomonas sp. AM2-LC TaxID=3153301 RepID=UPI0032635EC5
MQETIMFVIIEVLVILVIGLGVLQFLNWRNKTRRQNDLERFVDDINNNRNQRGQQIVSCLSSHYELEQPIALELSALLYGAEKQFLIQFVDKQMQNSVEGFYENLCELLDVYLGSIPVSAVHPEIPQSPAEELSEVADAESVETLLTEEPIEAAENQDEETKPNPAPDWGDVFD